MSTTLEGAVVSFFMRGTELGLMHGEGQSFEMAVVQRVLSDIDEE